MLLKLILALTLVPLVELYLLVKVAVWTSTPFTILLVLTTGVVGAAIARWQGLRVLRNMQADLRRGSLPARNIMEGVMVLVAGALLLTPGLLTDAAGFFLLAPPGRALLLKLLKRWLKRRLERERRKESPHWDFTVHAEPPEENPQADDDQIEDQ